MELPYTICFIKREDSILLLFRNKAPNKGKWNGVGGKIEKDETPYQAVYRETLEETGLLIKDLTFRGIVSWNNRGGMYVFTGTKIEGTLLEGPEGRLEWKKLDWIKTSDQVVSNMSIFLPEVLGAEPPKEHAFTYSVDGKIMDYNLKQLSSSIIQSAQKETSFDSVGSAN
ncbi:8-oxo-dGTP diphosphatase [Bacillus tianshenii]|uniref:8-oxo-dGTP diphosphatase n=1 Tax=Sutcliffiella tianshenii TaxID=1463404 RepID=A0ABS2NX94_9BACI|nr:8-oxo-dGTP diphosphatase [Bacillus tianshenii]MBM7619133.1 8-oxo-dGTP diphosphatase [Bacillus tianshenii]